jgi:hypothetical protein
MKPQMPCSAALPILSSFEHQKTNKCL